MRIVVAMALVLAGCDGEPSEPPPLEDDVTTLPTMTPCPGGWEESPQMDGSFVGCAPWPGAEPPSCGRFEAPWPADGCAPVGAPCPADGVPADLTADSVRYVGTADPDAYATIAEALADVPAGTTIALAAGTYEEMFTLPAGVALVGACPAETVISAPTGEDPVAAIHVDGADVTIRNLRIEGDRPGIYVDSGTLTLEDVVIEGTPGFAVRARRGTNVVARNYLVRDVFDAVERYGMHATGIGILGEGDASIDCERCTFLDNEGAGFWIGTSFVDTTRGRVSNSYFRNHLVGIGALSTDAQLEVETVLVEGASLGMLAWGAVVDGADIYLHDGIQRPGAPAASGFANVGGLVSITRMELSGMAGLGMLFMTAAEGELQDVVVRETKVDPRDGSGGRGIAVESGGLLTLRRGLIYRNVELGISAFNPGTEVNAEDVTIIRTDTSPQVAVGLGSYDEAHIEARRFRLLDNAVAGIQIAQNGGMDLFEGEVAGNEVGANVQVPGYDLERLRNEVQYRDNTVNLDATSLPVPSSAVPEGF